MTESRAAPSSVRAEFAADVAAAASALRRQPTVPAVSVAFAVLIDVLIDAHAGSWLWFGPFACSALFVFMLGWYGAERVFFQRQLHGKPTTVPHLLRLATFFVGRFFCLGVLFAIVLFSSAFALARAGGIDLTQAAEAGSGPLWLQLGYAGVLVAFDFALTFVTSALAYTTRSVVKALNIGVGMIAESWPRSALYVLCPPLALNVLNYIMPVGGFWAGLGMTAFVTVVSLVAKGAIAAFYLRERGSYSEDGAAYRVSDSCARRPVSTPREAPRRRIGCTEASTRRPTRCRRADTRHRVSAPISSYVQPF